MNLSRLQFCLLASVLAHGATLSVICLLYSSGGKLKAMPTPPAEHLIQITLTTDEPVSVTPEQAFRSSHTRSEPSKVIPAGPIFREEFSAAQNPIVDVPEIIPVAPPVEIIRFEIRPVQPSVPEPLPAFSAMAPSSERNSAIKANNRSLSTAVYLFTFRPSYPKEARKRREQGLVIIGVSINDHGWPVETKIAESSGFCSLDTAAVEAVKDWLFQPAVSGGIAVACEVEVPIRFEISN